MTARRFLDALAALALGLVLAGCNADDESGVTVSDLGQCAAPTYDASLAKFPLSALPTGQSCAANTECYLPVDTCPADLASPGGGVNETEYECTCGDAGWSCYTAIIVNSSCSDGGLEGGGEGGTEAGVDAGDASSGDAGALDAAPGG